MQLNKKNSWLWKRRDKSFEKIFKKLHVIYDNSVINDFYSKFDDRIKR
jgi:hypothetical protein